MKMQQAHVQDVYLGGLCFITDRTMCELTCAEMTDEVLRAGVQWVQYRDKEQPRKKLYHTALCLRHVTERSGACLIVNDHPDIAVAVGADGVHLGQDDMPIKEARRIMGPNRIIGVSTHSVEEAIKAEADGADYIGFGPLYATDTKDAGAPQGTQRLAEVRRAVSIPVVAIGGITCETVTTVFHAGAQAVAVASGLLRQGCIEQTASTFLTKIPRVH